MEEFAKKRLEICKACPISKEVPGLGLKCDSSQWLSPDGTQSSHFAHDGWIKGCGCFLSAKVAKLSNYCVARKW